MLSLKDINNISFPMAKKGYKVENVDDFIDSVASSYETLVKKCIDQNDIIEGLKSDKKRLEDEVAEANAAAAALANQPAPAPVYVPYSTTDEANRVSQQIQAELEPEKIKSEYQLEAEQGKGVIESALSEARKLSDGMISDANKKAEQIINDGSRRKDSIINDAHKQADQIIKDAEARAKALTEENNKRLQLQQEEVKKLEESAVNLRVSILKACKSQLQMINSISSGSPATLEDAADYERSLMKNISQQETSIKLDNSPSDAVVTAGVGSGRKIDVRDIRFGEDYDIKTENE